MSFSGWREVKLGDVCTYASAKVSVSEVSEDNYISTENMLPNKSGVTKSSGLPTVGSVTKYSAGNVLVSNIRPYFRKIWYADREGGCSNDVLVFEINDSETLDSKFLFYCLSNDAFFDYVMAGSKGTKMPRGDKGAIMKYPVPLPPLPEQKAIAATLSALDDMIELNNQINKTLEEMAQALFKSWFVDFEPFKEGEFEESELGLIPKGWRVGTLSSIGDIIGGGTPSKSKPEYYADSGIPWITPKDLSMNKNKYISRGQFDISELGLRESSAKLMPKGTVLFSSRAPIGYIAIAKNAVTTNQGFKSIVPFNNISSEYVYLLLKNNIGEIESRASGSTFKEISGGEMKKVPIILPPMDVINQFNEIATTLGKVQALLEDENNILSSIRDTLLPKLMSGEIRVPVEEVV
jgi:type I restriction enzyme S subunit